jgi:N-acyl-D-amino-acid deacylase
MPIQSVAWLAFAIAILCGAARAADEPSPNPTSAAGKGVSHMAPFDELLTKFIGEHKIPGGAVAVSRNGRLVYSRGFGYADVEAKAPVEPVSRFRIASISKPITAVAVLQLVEQGKLGLDERVFDLLKEDPNLPPHGTPDPRLPQITIRQLLQHTGGWDRDVSFDPMFRPIEIARDLHTAPPAGQAQVIRYMRGQPLDFQPGERYAYSNFGYCLLGRLIEHVSGEQYETFVKEHVLKPLGITRMQLGRTLAEYRADGEVTYYEPGDKRGPAVVGQNLGEDVPLPYGTWNLEAMDSHGGWIASAIDLVRFAAAFDDPARCPLLKPASIADMFARPIGAPGFDAEGKLKPFFYGLGWMVRNDVGADAVNDTTTPGERSSQWHTGSLDGTSTILVRRHDGLCWAVLFNTRNSVAEKAPARLIDLLMHKTANAIKEWPQGDEFGAR